MTMPKSFAFVALRESLPVLCSRPAQQVDPFKIEALAKIKMSAAEHNGHAPVQTWQRNSNGKARTV